MKNYRHIVLAIDFSDLSRVAVRRGLLEARANAARVSLVHVIEHFPAAVPRHWIAPENVDPVAYYRNQAAEELYKFAAELECEDATQEVVITDTSAGHALAEFARQHEANLIVAGIHGAWAIGMLGSTAIAVARQAACDVLLVR